MDDHSPPLGRRGEDLAASYLTRAGWRVLARNYRAGAKEIDLIVTRRDVVAFVEVKTRGTCSGGTAMEQVNRTKRRRVATAARRWIHENGRPGATYRFDAIAVERVGNAWHVRHLADAWRVGD